MIGFSSSYGVQLEAGPPGGGDVAGRFVRNTITDGNSYPVYAAVDRATLLDGSNSFTGNGSDQVFLLTNAHNSLTEPLSQDLTLQALNVPYWMNGDLYIGGDSTPTLTIEAGAEIRFSSRGLYIAEGGVLAATGTEGDPVVFTSNHSAPSPGDWTGIHFLDGSSGTLQYAHMKYATTGVQIHASDASVLDTTIEYSSSYGVKLERGTPLGGDLPTRFEGNSITAGNSYSVYAAVDRATLLDGSNSFTGNGSDQVFLLTNAHNSLTEPLSQDLTLQALNVPYWMNGDLYIGGDSTPTLTIEAGAEIRFSSRGLYIAEGGVLAATGTEGDPVVFTSNHSAPSPGDWTGIHFLDGSSGTLQYAHMKYATTGVQIHASDASVLDTTIEYSSSYGVKLERGTPLGGDDPTRFEGNSVTAGNTYPVYASLDRMTLLNRSNDLYGNGIDKVYLYTSLYDSAGESLDQDVTIDGHYMPILASSSLYVGGIASPTLTLAPGADLQFHSGKGLYIGSGGTLHAVGTSGRPVVLGPDDEVPSPGDWYGVDFLTDSAGTLIDSDIGYANIGVDVYGGSPTITSSHIHDNSSYGISVRAGATPNYSGNTYAGNPVDVNIE